MAIHVSIFQYFKVWDYNIRVCRICKTVYVSYSSYDLSEAIRNSEGSQYSSRPCLVVMRDTFTNPAEG